MKFTYSPFGEAFEKQTKTWKKASQSFRIFTIFWKVIPSTKKIISEKKVNPGIKNELENFKEQDQKIDRRKRLYKGRKTM